MSVSNTAGGRSRSLILTAMIFAVAMTFIDQTIVSIAAPDDPARSGAVQQRACSGRSTPTCWRWRRCSRSAGGWRHGRAPQDGRARGDHLRGGVGAVRRHAGGGAAEAWLVAFRAVQGAGGAIMFPAAIAIVVETFDLRSRGRALALFFGIAGGLTAIGPIAGGYLIQWTWRAIFWINIPVALIALALIAISKPPDESPARADGLPRPGPDHRRGRAERVRVPAVGPVGLGQPGHRGVHRRGRGPADRVRRRRAADRLATDERAHLHAIGRSWWRTSSC